MRPTYGPAELCSAPALVCRHPLRTYRPCSRARALLIDFRAENDYNTAMRLLRQFFPGGRVRHILRIYGGTFLKSLSYYIDRFCYKHPRFGIPNLMMYIIIGNVVVYLLDLASQGTFSLVVSFSPSAILHGQIWRLVSFVFVPDFSGNLFFFALSLYFYYFIGTTLERTWGSGRFTVFYLIGVLMSIVVGFVNGAIIGFDVPAVTSSVSYLNLSLFFAFATLYPETQFLLFFFIPVKAKWLGWVDAFFFLMAMVITPFPYNLIPVAAILNYIIFFWEDIVRVVRRGKFRHSRQTVNFKKATRQVKQQKGYLHKCSVCGKTDADFPNMEFRYCSKCKGYHCYCMDHINNHVHITDE